MNLKKKHRYIYHCLQSWGILHVHVQRCSDAVKVLHPIKIQNLRLWQLQLLLSVKWTTSLTNNNRKRYGEHYKYVLFSSRGIYIGCSPGFHGLRCKNKCRYPTFGLRCERKCDCRQQMCHFINGCPLPGDKIHFLMQMKFYYFITVFPFRRYTEVN